MSASSTLAFQTLTTHVRAAMTADELERHLHEQIPISAAMGVRVLVASPRQVRLSAPLKPNINHMQTVFGGSAVAIATLAPWALLSLKLQHAQAAARLVIQRSSMHYEQLIPGDFEALCTFDDEPAWERFLRTLGRHGRARTPLSASLLLNEERMATFQGDFVALAP